MFELDVRVFFDKFLSVCNGFFRVIVVIVARNSDFQVFRFGDRVFDFEFQIAKRFRFKRDADFIFPVFEISDVGTHVQSFSERKRNVFHVRRRNEISVAEIDRNFFNRDFAPVNFYSRQLADLGIAQTIF